MPCAGFSSEPDARRGNKDKVFNTGLTVEGAEGDSGADLHTGYR